jgi:hypothetical protein
MKCFFDENLGKQLTLGLRGFGEDAIHLTEKFSPGTPDDVWLPFVGIQSYILFTVDKRIRRRPLQKQLLKDYKVGSIFLMGKSMSRWNYIRQVVRAWEKIEKIAEREPRPFAFQVNRHGTEVTKIQLD